VIINMTTAAKHPPDQNGGKVSANEQKGGKAYARPRPLQPGHCRQNERRQAQKRKHSEESGRPPPPPELPRRRLQEGSDAAGTVIVRQKRLRLSPRKLTGEKGREAKNDAFKKVNGT
jgi:hypothetical protein